MTVIAWDGRTLAADKQNTCHGYASAVTKVYLVPGGRVGFAGNAYHAMELLAWFNAGRPADAWPAPADRNDCADALFVDDERSELWLYCGQSAYGQRLEDTYTAMGCGRDYALAALHLGKTAREAVDVACALDVRCGCGVDVLELQPSPTEGHRQ